MRKLLLLVSILLVHIHSSAQERVKWTFTYDNSKKEVAITAVISDGWHLYSQHINNAIGPVPTTFTFEENPNIVYAGKVIEPTPIHEYDENFEAELDFFKNQVVFTRKISKAKSGETIKGYVTFMVCNEVMCLPPVDYNFSIQIP